MIDPAPPTSSSDPVMFAVVKSKHSGGTFHHTIAAWDPVSNSILSSFDVGNALGWTSSVARFQHQRASLALSHEAGTNNAIVYVAWGSHCDASPYQGWVAALKFDYASGTFSLLGSTTDEPPAEGKGGIWMAGAAPAIDDATGDLYLVTGNGAFSPTAQEFGNTVARFRKPTLTGPPLNLNGSYTPNKWLTSITVAMSCCPLPLRQPWLRFPMTKTWAAVAWFF